MDNKIIIALNSIALDPNRWNSDKRAFYKLEELLPPVAEAGFHFIELWQYHISEEDEVHIKAIRDYGKSYDLYFPVTGIYPVLHYTGADRQKEIDRIKRLFEYSQILCSSIVKIFAGNKSAAEISEKEYWDSIEFLNSMLVLAKSYGLVITGETHRKTLLEDVNCCKKLMNDIKPGNFRFCFQPYDFQNTDRYISDYQALADNVIHIHFQGRKDKKPHYLKESDIDHELVINTVVNSGFSGHLSIEFVKDCIVNSSDSFNLNQVLQNAQFDRDYLLTILSQYDIEVES
jgi:sugar phosphate isomerase/epimerase